MQGHRDRGLADSIHPTRRSAAATRVLIADDHPLMRECLRHILPSTSRLVIAGEADDGTSTISLVPSVPARVIVLDLSMPGRAGVELIKQIKLDKPTLRILVLIMHAEQQYALRSFKAVRPAI